MNWTRGLFRLWVVLSLAWTFFIFVDLRPDLAFSEYRSAKAKIAEGDGPIGHRELAAAAEKAAAAGRVDDAESLREMAASAREGVKYYKSYDTTKIDREINKLRRWVVVTLIPIVVLFSFGAGMLWIFSGFRRDHT